jgi:hypothetical protein
MYPLLNNSVREGVGSDMFTTGEDEEGWELTLHSYELYLVQA